mgnify:CR=1 FL=1
MTNLLDKFRKEHNLEPPESQVYKYFRRVSMDDFIKRCNELKDRLSLSQQEIEDAIHSACDFFGIAYPMLIIDLSNKKYGQTMFVNTDPVSFNDDVICYSIQQLQELGVTDKDLEEAFKDGARTWEDLQSRTKIGSACGGCKDRAMEKMHEFEHLYGE